MEYLPPYLLAGHAVPLAPAVRQRIHRALERLPAVTHSRLLIMDKRGAYRPSYKDFPRDSGGRPTFPRLFLSGADDPSSCPFLRPTTGAAASATAGATSDGQPNRKSRRSTGEDRKGGGGGGRRKLFSTGQPLQRQPTEQKQTTRQRDHQQHLKNEQNDIPSGNSKRMRRERSDLGGGGNVEDGEDEEGDDELRVGPDDERLGGYCENCKAYFKETVKQVR